MSLCLCFLSIKSPFDLSLFTKLWIVCLLGTPKNKNKTNSVASVHKRTISTVRPPLVGEVSANFITKFTSTHSIRFVIHTGVWTKKIISILDKVTWLILVNILVQCSILEQSNADELIKRYNRNQLQCCRSLWQSPAMFFLFRHSLLDVQISNQTIRHMSMDRVVNMD
jgi:hypothetical protein